MSRGADSKLAGHPDGGARILEAAIKSFAEQGYAGTITAGVALCHGALRERERR